MIFPRFKTFKIKFTYFVAKNDIAYYDQCDLLSAGGTLDKKTVQNQFYIMERFVLKTLKQCLSFKIF